MVGNSPGEATEAFINRFRSTLACLVRGVAIGSGSAIGTTHSVTLYVEGQDDENVARLRTHGGSGELLFRFAHLYTVDRFEDRPEVPFDLRRGLYQVRSTYYRYDILNRDEEEIVVFHWEPEGRGTVNEPHLHVSAAPPIVLPQRPGSGLANVRTYLAGMRIPTNRIFVEDAVRFLIREFRVDPVVDDWETIIRDNIAAIQRGRTW